MDQDRAPQEKTRYQVTICETEDCNGGCCTVTSCGTPNMSSKDDTPFEFVEAKEGRRTKYRGIQGNKRKMKKKRCDFGVFYPLDEGSSRGSPSSVITTFVGQPVLCNTGGQTNGSVWETGSNLRVDSSAPTQLEETTSSQGQRLSSQSGPFCGRSFFTTMSSTSRPVLPEGNDIDLTDEEAANDWFDVVDVSLTILCSSLAILPLLFLLFSIKIRPNNCWLEKHPRIL